MPLTQVNKKIDEVQKGWIGNTTKLVAALISSLAALVSVLSFARSYGIIGRPASHLTVGDLGAKWLGVSPAHDTVTSVGDTLHLAATVTDQNGSVLVGASIVWSSVNPKVATVDADGTVISRGSGATAIVASVGNLIARSQITVQQRVAAVHVNDDTTVSVPEGERVRVEARAVDARGTVVAGRAATWRLSDTTVAAVDSAGSILGKAQGTATLVATVDGVTAQAPVRVVAVPGSVALVTGGAQRAAAGATLPQPVVVRVLSTRGRPIAQTTVRFRSADGRSTFDPTTAVTDADGRARTTWTLGDAPGRQRLLADVDHVDSALAVVAEADPIAANTRAAAINDQQSARAGERLPQPVAVRLSDTTGRPLVDVPVAWVALDGGIVKTLEARTDSLGDARAEWTLAPRAGAQHVRALIGGTRTVPPVVLTAVAGAGAPAAASLVSGDGQHGTAGAPLAKPLVLRVVDRTGNPVPGVRVTVRPKTGTVADTTLETDSAGTAAVRWTLAQAAGGQRLSIRAEGVARPVDATAVAAPDVPANVDFGPAPDAGVVGRALGERISVTVTDQYGNAIASAPVVFTTRVGSATPTRVATDAAGRAATRWTLGPTPGEQSLVAAVRGTDARATLTVRAEVPGAKTAKPSRTAPSTKPTAAAKVAKPVAAPLAKKVTPHRGR